MAQAGIIEVYGYGLIDLNTISSENIRLETICHALSRLCRFGGHTSEFYSVAEHSVNVFRLAQGRRCEPIATPTFLLQALLHDAAEAYVIDLPRPIKIMLPRYKVIEDKVQAAVWEWAGIDAPEGANLEILKELDDAAIHYEAANLMRADWWSRELVTMYADDMEINCYEPCVAAAELETHIVATFNKMGLEAPY
jgi:hypothetical protein